MKIAGGGELAPFRKAIKSMLVGYLWKEKELLDEFGGYAYDVKDGNTCMVSWESASKFIQYERIRSQFDDDFDDALVRDIFFDDDRGLEKMVDISEYLKFLARSKAYSPAAGINEDFDSWENLWERSCEDVTI